MKTTVKRGGHIFEIKETKFGIKLIYLGSEDWPFKQFIVWPCDNMEEVEDMINAVLDPSRYADDEHRARHAEEIMNNCKW